VRTFSRTSQFKKDVVIANSAPACGLSFITIRKRVRRPFWRMALKYEDKYATC
jgi:hypothetical protein